MPAVAVLVAAMLPAVFADQPPASAAAQETYYVAPDGNDANPGTVQAPFRTVQRARDVVRTVNASMSGDIQVYLRGGRYPVSSTIEFGPGDSGTNGYRVVYAGYPGETPILDGGVQVTGWTQHSGNIWKAPLDRANKLRTLYVNDKRAFMASKTINSAGCHGTYNITAGQAAWAWESGSQCDGARYNSADFPAIARNQDDIEIETATTWTTAIVGVRQVTTDGGSRIALFQQPGAAIAQGAFNGNAQVGGSHKVMNAYEFLDAPGEFFFDRSSRTLYYYRASSENMSTATVFAPNNVTTLLRVAGTSTSDHVRDITFSGLTVQHSDWNLFDVAGSVFKQAQQGNLGAQAYAKGNFHVYYYRNVDVTPGMIQIQNADGILLRRNRIQHTGADGISLVNDVQNSQLIGNHTNDIAGSAISVGHPQHVYIGDHTSTNREKYPRTSKEYRRTSTSRTTTSTTAPSCSTGTARSRRTSSTPSRSSATGSRGPRGRASRSAGDGGTSTGHRARSHPTGRPRRRETTPSATTTSSTRCSGSATPPPSTPWAASRGRRSPTTICRAFPPATSTASTRTRVRRS
ncbi:hypothetical protein GCM10027615_28650 [Plantactinospora veratri]